MLSVFYHFWAQQLWRYKTKNCTQLKSQRDFAYAGRVALWVSTGKTEALVTMLGFPCRGWQQEYHCLVMLSWMLLNLWSSARCVLRLEGCILGHRITWNSASTQWRSRSPNLMIHGQLSAEKVKNWAASRKGKSLLGNMVKKVGVCCKNHWLMTGEQKGGGVFVFGWKKPLWLSV